MNLGTTIKKLRIQLGKTQEQLAEYLNVSVSAVSQWESGKTVPDVSTLVVMADFFDVSLDELFGRTPADKEKQIKEYEKLSMECNSSGELSKRLALWREAVQKYPGDFTCLSKLAYTLLMLFNGTCEKDRREEIAKECLAICERIMRDCKDSFIRNDVIQILVYLYSREEISFANENKAVEYAMMASSAFACRDELLANAHFTPESKEKKLCAMHRNILTYTNLLTQNMLHAEYGSIDDKCCACKAALKLWETIIYDGNYLFYHSSIYQIYILLASCYAKLERKAETLDALKNAFYHAERFDAPPEDKQHYTSIFVKAQTFSASNIVKNYSSPTADGVKSTMKKKEFDFLRDDEEFITLKNR